MNAKDFIMQLHRPTLFRYLHPGDRFHMHDGTEAMKRDGLTWQRKGMPREAANRDYMCYPLDWDAAAIRSFGRSRQSKDPRYQKESMTANVLICILLEDEQEDALSEHILNWFKGLLLFLESTNRRHWKVESTGQVYKFDWKNRTVTLVHNEPDPVGRHERTTRYLAALGFKMVDAQEPPGAEDHQVFAEALVDQLLETGAAPMNPTVDAYRHRFHRSPMDGYWQTKPDWVFRQVREIERDMDASHRSLEGEPSPEERKREQARNMKFDPVPRTPRNSVTMATNRNQRRKSFGFSDYRDSMRDRKWPTSPGYHKPYKAKPSPDDSPSI